jgi:hypothetical protein
MIIERVSPVTGKKNTMELPINEDQLLHYTGGMLAQRAFPGLSLAEREFLISGCTPACWDSIFPEEEE